MKRDDWIFVGVRLFGLYLVGAVLLNLSSSWYMASAPRDTGWPKAALIVGLPLVLGLALFFGAPAIVRWLASADACVEEFASRSAEEEAEENGPKEAG